MSHQPNNILAGTQFVLLIGVREKNRSLAWCDELLQDFGPALKEANWLIVPSMGWRMDFYQSRKDTSNHQVMTHGNLD